MMTKHLSKTDITGYIYHSLDDAQREIMDMHLIDCQICRADLSEQEFQQRKISNALSSVLKAASPSGEMNFAAISAQIHSRYTYLNLFPRLAAVIPPAFALAGLLLAVLGLWRLFDGNITLSLASQSLGALPTMACFFLIFASVGQFNGAPSSQTRFFITLASALILWLGSIFIGLLNLIVIRDLAILAVVALGGNSSDAAPIAIMAVLLGVVILIAVIFGSGEYHYRNVGQPGSWKLFASTILGQLFILMIPYLIM